MKQNNCLAFQAELEEAASTNRSPGSSARQHLADCADCAGTFGEHARLRELISGLEPVTAPADFEFRLRARLAGTAPGRGSGLAWRWTSWRTPVLGLASALVLVIGGATVYNAGLFHGGSSVEVIAAASVGRPEGTPLDWTGFVVAPVAVVPTVAVLGSRYGIGRAGTNRANNGSGGVSTSSVKGTAEAIVPVGFRQPNPDLGSEFSVPVSPSNSSGRIMVDEGGRMRNVSLRTVSFGSQDLMDPAVSRSAHAVSARVW